MPFRHNVNKKGGKKLHSSHGRIKKRAADGCLAPHRSGHLQKIVETVGCGESTVFTWRRKLEEGDVDLNTKEGSGKTHWVTKILIW